MCYWKVKEWQNAHQICILRSHGNITCKAKLRYLAQEIHMQRIEGATWFLYDAQHKMQDED